jgi:hypothetical protein
VKINVKKKEKKKSFQLNMVKMNVKKKEKKILFSSIQCRRSFLKKEKILSARYLKKNIKKERKKSFQLNN